MDDFDFGGVWGRMDLAEALGVTYQVLYWSERKGYIPRPSVRFGRCDRYAEAEVRAVYEWAKARAGAARKEADTWERKVKVKA